MISKVSATYRVLIATCAATSNDRCSKGDATSDDEEDTNRNGHGGDGRKFPTAANSIDHES